MSKEFSRICLTVVMPASGRKKPKWSGKVLVGAGDRFAARQVLGLEVYSVGRQDEFRLRLGGRRAGLQRGERLRDLARRADGDVDVVGLKNAAQVGLVRGARAQPLDRRLLVAEGFKEGDTGNSPASNGCSAKCGNGFFDFNGVQLFAPPGVTT